MDGRVEGPCVRVMGTGTSREKKVRVSCDHAAKPPGICRFAGKLAIWPVFLLRMIGSVWSCIYAFVSMDMVVSTGGNVSEPSSMSGPRTARPPILTSLAQLRCMEAHGGCGSALY
jgi:hypothetical protein